jgi:hypothetical protein
MKKKRVTACAAVVLLGLIPLSLRAQAGLGIFDTILSTITGSIGGALTEINSIRTSILQTEQQVLWPVSLIDGVRSYITTIKSSYRGWMNSVVAIPVNSAVLTTPKSLEASFLSGNSGQISAFGQTYTSTYGVQPVTGAAPTAHLQMMDIEDALAKDATAQSMAADQSSATMLQTAQRIEDESQTTAPGTADMVVASARTAELASLAIQHRMLAYQLRESAIQLSHRGAILKQSATNMQNMNQQIVNHLGGTQ